MGASVPASPKKRQATYLVGLILITFAATPARADWKAEWEKTVAAAKKEGRVNLYIGRYGQAPLLAEFTKEFPEIKLVTVNGSGNSLGTRIITEIRAGHVVAHAAALLRRLAALRRQRHRHANGDLHPHANGHLY